MLSLIGMEPERKQGMDGKGHPLPRSDEARHNEIPEHLARHKGRGDDARALVQPEEDPVAPDGEPYRYGDLGRGPGSARQAERAEPRRDRAEHQDRGQGAAEAEIETETDRG